MFADIPSVIHPHCVQSAASHVCTYDYLKMCAFYLEHKHACKHSTRYLVSKMEFETIMGKKYYKFKDSPRKRPADCPLISEEQLAEMRLSNIPPDYDVQPGRRSVHAREFCFEMGISRDTLQGWYKNLLVQYHYGMFILPHTEETKECWMCKAFVQANTMCGTVCGGCADRWDMCYEPDPSRLLPVPKIGARCLVSLADACSILRTSIRDIELDLQHEVRILHDTSIKKHRAMKYVEMETAKVPVDVTRKTLAWQNRFPSYAGCVGLLHVPRIDAVTHLEVSYGTFNGWEREGLVRKSDKLKGGVEFPVHFKL